MDAKSKPKLIFLLILAIIIFAAAFVFNSLFNNKAPIIFPSPTIKPGQSLVTLIFNLNQIDNLKASLDNNNVFDYKIREMRGHCNWNYYQLVLENGTHSFTVENTRTNAINSKEFIVSQETWFYISFSPSENSIFIDQSNQGIGCE